MTYIDQFLSTLNSELPDICADKDLIQKVQVIFRSPSTLARMRDKNVAPPHFYIEPNYYYLKGDVISWLRSNYK